MEYTKDDLSPSKKRAAEQELNRDGLGVEEEENTVEVEIGTFERASEEVLAARRFVKVCCNHGLAPDMGPSQEEPSLVNESEETEPFESTAMNSEGEDKADKDEEDAENIEVNGTEEVHAGPVSENEEEDKESEQKENGSEEAEEELAQGSLEEENETREAEERDTRETEEEPSTQEDPRYSNNGNDDVKDEAKPKGDDEDPATTV